MRDAPRITFVDPDAAQRSAFYAPLRIRSGEAVTVGVVAVPAAAWADKAEEPQAQLAALLQHAHYATLEAE